MNASHAANIATANPRPAGTPPVHAGRRTALLAMYAALVAQLAVWSILAARVSLTAAFTQAHRGAEADVVVGGAVWLAQFTLAVVLATIRYRRNWR
jgi:FtsH-binding integral membrane protein